MNTTLKEIFSSPYLSARAEQALRDSLHDYENSPDERVQFAAFWLKQAESADASLEILDELYLASL